MDIEQAFRNGDFPAVIDAITWDEAESITSPEGTAVTLARIGKTQVAMTPHGDRVDGSLSIHMHDSESDAAECFRGTVDNVRGAARQAEQLMAFANMLGLGQPNAGSDVITESAYGPFSV